MDFESYLTSKKIDSAAFRQSEPELWEEWKLLFQHLHPKSFTAQKLYLINPLRRRFPAPHVEPETKPPAKPVSATPVVKPAVAKPVFKPQSKAE